MHVADGRRRARARRRSPRPSPRCAPPGARGEVPLHGPELPQPGRRDALGSSGAREILEIARRHGVLVLEDNPYGLLGFDGEPLPALRSMDDEGVIYLGSFSKTFAPGSAGRLGAGAARGAREARAGRRGGDAVPVAVHPAGGRPLPGQPRLAGPGQASSASCTASAATRCSTRWPRMLPGTTLDRARTAASTSWVTLPGGLDAKAMLPRAVTARVAYVPGTAFYADGTRRRRPSHLRLSYCYPSRSASARACAGWPASSRPSSSCATPSAPTALHAPGRRLPGPFSRTGPRVSDGSACVPRPRPAGCRTSATSRCAPGRRVADALRECRRRGAREPTLDAGAARHGCASDRPDVVLPLLHGAAGEDGALRDVLDAGRASPTSGRRRRGLPAWPSTSRRPRRRWWRGRASHVPTSVVAAARRVPRARRRRRCSTRAGRPARAAARGEAGPRRLGARRADRRPSADELPRAMVGCFAYGDVALVEQLVAGTEVAVSVRRHRRRPAGAAGRRDRPDGGRLRLRRPLHRRRHASSSPRPGSTEPPPTALRRGGRAGAHRARPARPVPHRPHRRRRRRAQPWFLEVNVAPGMTETSLLPQAVEAAGLDLRRLYRGLVDAAARARLLSSAEPLRRSGSAPLQGRSSVCGTAPRLVRREHCDDPVEVLDAWRTRP